MRAYERTGCLLYAGSLTRPAVKSVFSNGQFHTAWKIGGTNTVSSTNTKALDDELRISTFRVDLGVRIYPKITCRC